MEYLLAYKKIDSLLKLLSVAKASCKRKSISREEARWVSLAYQSAASNWCLKKNILKNTTRCYWRDKLLQVLVTYSNKCSINHKQTLIQLNLWLIWRHLRVVTIERYNSKDLFSWFRRNIRREVLPCTPRRSNVTCLKSHLRNGLTLTSRTNKKPCLTMLLKGKHYLIKTTSRNYEEEQKLIFKYKKN